MVYLAGTSAQSPDSRMESGPTVTAASIASIATPTTTAGAKSAARKKGEVWLGWEVCALLPLIFYLFCYGLDLRQSLRHIIYPLYSESSYSICLLCSDLYLSYYPYSQYFKPVIHPLALLHARLLASSTASTLGTYNAGPAAHPFTSPPSPPQLCQMR